MVKVSKIKRKKESRIKKTKQNKFYLFHVEGSNLRWINSEEFSGPKIIGEDTCGMTLLSSSSVLNSGSVLVNRDGCIYLNAIATKVQPNLWASGSSFSFPIVMRHLWGWIL